MTDHGSHEHDSGLADLKARLDLLIPQIDLFDGEFTPDQLAAFDAAKRSFLAAGPEILAAATEHLWAYYRGTAEEFTPEDREDYGIPELGADADIWAEVSITGPPVLDVGGEPLAPAAAYLSFEGEVSWEDEHGLQLVFENGRTVCKVGPYDGHSTNAHAHGDPSLLTTVYE